MKDLLLQRLAQLEKHFEKNNLFSYDPYDGLNIPLRFFLFKIKILERIWLQGVRKLPINLRKLLGIKKMQHTKTVSDLLSTSSILYIKTKSPDYLKKAEHYYSILKQISLKEKSGTAWGLNFFFTTRFVQASPRTPNLFNTINSINSLLDYYSVSDKNKEEVKHLIADGLNFIFNDLGFKENGKEVVWNYWQGLHSEIFNVNALMAGLLSRIDNVFKNKDYREKILKTIEFLRRNQNEDGSWNYSSDAKGNFIDGFHTGYILEGLCIVKLNSVKFDEEFFLKGIEYFLNNFFAKENLPKYFNNSFHPVDGQNFAQIIQTLYYLEQANLVDKEYLQKVFFACDELLWNKNGYYNYMKTKSFTYKTSMDRWVNAPMYLAISKLV